MLIVADETALRIARERRLACARESEEERRVAGLPHVRRAVHREHTLERQRVVENREDGFLDLAGVLAPGNQHELPSEMHVDGGFGP